MRPDAAGARANRDEIGRQGRCLSDFPHLRSAFDAVPEPLAVLNSSRQVVLANRALADLAGVGDPSRILGQRPGEFLGCTRACEAPCGCGNTEFCRACGACTAVLAAHGGRAQVSECRISRNGTPAALDLRISAAPFRAGDEDFTVFSLVDVGHENRRRALERVFFHDVLNTAGNLKTLADLLADADAAQVARYRPLLARLTGELLGQIREQRDLAAAESGDLPIRVSEVRVGPLLEEVAAAHAAQGASGQVSIRVRAGTGGESLRSDGTLLRRVLGNMVKNAVEASGPGEEVTLGHEAAGGAVRLWVHNPAPMPPEVQLQIFQRSFSTKGQGRGLGTYGMRLLGERYLGGAVSFTSTPEDGTRFAILCPRDLGPGD